MTHGAVQDGRTVRRQLRVLAILAGAERVGLSPLPGRQVHAIAFFADALAPVWGLRILDAQLLKRKSGPFSTTLQRDLDSLVGRGIVEPLNVGHAQDEDGMWRLGASYKLNWEMAGPILELAGTFSSESAQLRLTQEIVMAVSALGEDLSAAPLVDAAYSDLLVGLGEMVDIAGSQEHPNLSATVALRFGELMRGATSVNLTPTEMVHLYVRELAKRVVA